jgi:hypothetical protein
MARQFETADVVIGLLAGIGIVILIGVFTYVLKQVILRKNGGP